MPEEEVTLDIEAMDRDEIAAGRCPECHISLFTLNNCSNCGFRNVPQGKFCSMCGKPVDTTPTPAAIKAHAEEHWGKDFDKTSVDPEKMKIVSEKTPGVASDHMMLAKAHGTPVDPSEASKHAMFKHHGVVHDENHFPDAVRRFKMVAEFDPSKEVSGKPPPQPKQVLHPESAPIGAAAKVETGIKK